jgi:acyl-CoA synthetase (NDP forming)
VDNDSRGLDRLLSPRSVAVIGASRRLESLAGRAFAYTYGRRGDTLVYPVNPHAPEVMGVTCYPDVAEIPGDPVDVAYIVVNGAASVEAVEQCGRHGVRHVIVASSGFTEVGPEGAALERELAACARHFGIRMLGPNTNGLWNPRLGLSVGFNVSHGDPLRAGGAAFIAHTGALLGSALRRCSEMGGGISWAVATGNEADLEVSDFLEYAARDDSVRQVVLLLDALKDTPRFIAAAAAARRGGKDLVVLKMGRSAAGRRAAELHSSRIAGDAEAFSALLGRLGAAEAGDVESLIGALVLLERHQAGYSRELLGISTSGAGASILADLASSRSLDLPVFTEQTRSRLASHMHFTKPHNPVDLTGQSSDSEWLRVVYETIAADRSGASLAFLITLLPDEGGSAARATVFAEVTQRTGRAALVYAPGRLSAENVARLNAAGVTVFANGPEAMDSLRLAAEVTATRHQAGEWRPAELSGVDVRSLLAAGKWPAGLGRTLVHDRVSALCRDWQLPMPRQRVIRRWEDAAAAAAELGFPLVVKLLADDIVHKNERNGVATGLRSAAEVTDEARRMLAEAGSTSHPRILVQEQVEPLLEFILGYRFDDQAGPVIILGFGGTDVEIDPDVSVQIAPVSGDGLSQMLASLRKHRLLERVPGVRPAAIADALADVVVPFSLHVAQSWDSLESFEINPLALARRDGHLMALALDVRGSVRPGGWTAPASWARFAAITKETENHGG